MRRLRSTDVLLMPWKWQGIVAVGGDSEQLSALAKQVGIDMRLEGHELGRAYVELGKPWILWLASLDDPATLAHEALHIISGVLEGRGLKHTPESEEAYTYTMEDLMRQILAAKKWQRHAN